MDDADEPHGAHHARNGHKQHVGYLLRHLFLQWLCSTAVQHSTKFSLNPCRVQTYLGRAGAGSCGSGKNRDPGLFPILEMRETLLLAGKHFFQH